MDVSFIEVIILGIIQGLTEFLPVSSSGHVKIAEVLLNVHNANSLLLVLSLHFGTFVAVVYYFRNSLINIVKTKDWNLLKLLFISTIPLGLTGLFLRKTVESVFSSSLNYTAFGLMFTAFMIIISKNNEASSSEDYNAEADEEIKKMTVMQAFIIGLAQAIAVCPGVSRSGTTIATGLLLGYKGTTSAKYSFLISIPALGGVMLVMFLENLTGNTQESANASLLFTGISVSCVVGFFALKFLIIMIKKAKLTFFAIYCLMIAMLAFSLAKDADSANLKAENATVKKYILNDTVMGDIPIQLTLWMTAEQAKYGQDFLDVFHKVDKTLSTYKPESEISAMNKNAVNGPFQCSDLLWENLLKAQEIFKLSNGYFDVTVGPLMKLWGFKAKHNQAPTDQEIQNILKNVGMDKIRFNQKNHTVDFQGIPLSVDLGGIAKGYVVDKVYELVRSKGISSGIIELGGNLRCFGKPLGEKREFFNIGVRDPTKRNENFLLVKMKEQSVATSGNYERFVIYKGKKYTHIINPKTGYPVEGADSVTVIHPSAFLCDALSTAIFSAGSELIAEIAKKYPDIHILFLKDMKTKPIVIKSGSIWERQ